MSQRTEVEDRIRELARQHPGWTPSQIAIYLQGENLKVTSEDVRRALARAEPGEGEQPVGVWSRYTPPPPVRRRPAWPIGIAFGIITFVVVTAVEGYLLTVGKPGVSFFVILTLLVMFIITGTVASRLHARASVAGAIAGFLEMAITFAVIGAALSGLAGSMGGLPSAMGMNLVTLGKVGVNSAFIIGAIIVVVIATIVGAVFGWIGRLLFGPRRRRGVFGY